MLTVIEITQALAGPTSGRILGALGARVVKLERRGGDPDRLDAPLLSRRNEIDSSNAVSVSWAKRNANKLGITLDITRPEGRSVLTELVKRADVLLQNNRSSAAQKLGLDFNTLHQSNPRLVVCSITGFGNDGPRSDWSSYDPTSQAASGLMMNNSIDGQTPLAVGLPLVDYLTSLYAVIGILDAVRVRDETGEGRHVEVCMLDVASSVVWDRTPDHPPAEISPRPTNGHPFAVPWNTYATTDGYVSIAAMKAEQWAKLADVIGAPHLRDADLAARRSNRRLVDEAITRWTRTLSKRDIAQQLQDIGIASSAVLSGLEAAGDPQVQARHLVSPIPEPGTGAPTDFLGARFPILVSDWEATKSSAPTLGQHNDLVYGEWLGMSSDERSHLAAIGVI